MATPRLHHRYVAFAITITILSPLFANSSQATTEEVDLCTLLSKRAYYNGKQVIVSGVIATGRHGSQLRPFTRACAGLSERNSYVDPYFPKPQRTDAETRAILNLFTETVKHRSRFLTVQVMVFGIFRSRPPREGEFEREMVNTVEIQTIRELE